MEEQKNALKAKPGELRATVTITRAATGKTETFEIIGHEQPAALKTEKEKSDVGNT